MKKCCRNLVILILLTIINVSLPAASQEQVAETVYVQEGDMNGTLVPSVQVTGQDGAGSGFEGATDSNGTVVISGLPGIWQFLFMKEGYEPLNFSSNVTETAEGVVYLQKSCPSPEDIAQTVSQTDQNSQVNQTRTESRSVEEWYNLGIALQNEGKYAEAAQAFDEAVKDDPKFTMAWYNKYTALRKLGRNDEADAALSEAKNLSYDTSL